MTELGQKLYVKGQTAMNKLKRNEEGSTAVEFMGIAAVVVVIIVLLTTFFGEGNEGGNLIEGIFRSLISKVTNWFN